MSPRLWITIGAALAALAVAAGAFGAHGLERRVESGAMSPRQLEQFETAARYHLYHAIGLVLVGLASRTGNISGLVAGCCFLLGIVLFSGCLYGYVFTQSKPLVALVPVGGLAFIVGWIALAIGACCGPGAAVDG